MRSLLEAIGVGQTRLRHVSFTAAATSSRGRDVLDQDVGANATFAEIVADDDDQTALAVGKFAPDHGDAAADALTKRVAEHLQVAHVARPHRSRHVAHTIPSDGHRLLEQRLQLIAPAAHRFLDAALQYAPLLEELVDASLQLFRGHAQRVSDATQLSLFAADEIIRPRSRHGLEFVILLELRSRRQFPPLRGHALDLPPQFHLLVEESVAGFAKLGAFAGNMNVMQGTARGVHGTLSPNSGCPAAAGDFLG